MTTPTCPGCIDERFPHDPTAQLGKTLRGARSGSFATSIAQADMSQERSYALEFAIGHEDGLADPASWDDVLIWMSLGYQAGYETARKWYGETPRERSRSVGVDVVSEMPEQFRNSL